MQHVELVLLFLLVAVAALTWLARVLGVPYPVLLIVGGSVIGVVSGVPNVELEPDLGRTMSRPPLLFHAAYFASLREMRLNARAISLNACALVLVTMSAAGRHARRHGARCGRHGAPRPARRRVLLPNRRRAGLVVMSLGLGCVMGLAMGTATFGVDPADAGVAGATVNTMQQVGGSLGTALLSTLAIGAMTSRLAGARRTPELVAAASAHGYTTAFWWSAALLATGAVLSWLLIESRSAQALAPDTDATPAQPVMAH